MEKKACLILAFLLMLSCHEAATRFTRQEDALKKLNSAKYSGKSGIDVSDFQAPDISVGGEEIGGVNKTSSSDINFGASLPLVGGGRENDRIQNLPGQPPVKFSQYGGYVTVDATAGRALYYYFAEAETLSKSLPLLLWLNGGPGCSSLGYGAMEELGPFRVNSDGKTLYKNKYAWNNAANVLFLESPAGVGYSYSNRTSDYTNCGDRETAEDNYKFLVNWMNRFPEYKGRDFYISGESYAGHYVPQLAHTILAHNKKAGKAIINLKGIAIGNAVINDETDNKGMYDFFGTHALTSLETMEIIQKSCDFSPKGITNPSSECFRALNKADNDTSDFDIYNIYASLCRNNHTTPKPKMASLTNFDPCSDYYVYAYLNRADVQQAMHANVTKLTHDWQPCSNVIQGWIDSTFTVIPLLQEFMANGLRVLVYSGDIDGRVPVTSTQYSLRKLNLTSQTDWYPWFLDGEVGGYAQVYIGNLTFATVRGAGHEVPSYQPDRALTMIKYFLSGKPLPKNAKEQS